jgi:hypothetical protein
MMRNQITNFWNSAAQFFFGSIVLALVTLVFFRLGVDLASTAFAYLIVIVLASLMAASARQRCLPSCLLLAWLAFLLRQSSICGSTIRNISWWSPSCLPR